MLERQVFLPLAPEPLWDDMTSPDGLDDWLGLEVDWCLEPGRPASFREPDGEERDGVIDEVEPGRRLRFRWWPADRPEAASEVTWTLEPDGAGTRLTVVERPAGAPSTTTTATASLGAGSLSRAAPTWDRQDEGLFRAWARAHRPVALARR
jgi:uncharacterized protein YndB with AHSA1/START domain